MDPTQLRDIHAVLGNPWWPLAPGWWLLLATLVALWLLGRSLRGALSRAGRFGWRLPVLAFGDWRNDASRALLGLRRAGREVSLKARAAALSELLRRIAMARHGRAACAGLTGAAWLNWLAAHDPAGFDWRTEGLLLLRAPYAPEAGSPADRAGFMRLLDATEAWIHFRPPRRAATRPSRQDPQQGPRRRPFASLRARARRALGRGGRPARPESAPR